MPRFKVTLPDDVLARVREDVEAANAASARVVFRRRLTGLVELAEKRGGSNDLPSVTDAEEERCELTHRTVSACPCGVHGGEELCLSERAFNVAESIALEGPESFAFWLARALVWGLQNR